MAVGKNTLMDPKVDYVFKLIFGLDKDECKIALRGLLNSILNLEDKIKEIVYLNPYLDKQYEEDKQSILDIKVKTNKGEKIDIEMQLVSYENLKKRFLYYWSKLYIDDFKSGEDYEKLNKVIQIIIVKDDLIKETKKYHTKYKIKEVEENFEYINDMELHIIELGKFFENEKNVEKMDRLERWLTFLKDADDESKRKVIEKIIEREEEIKMAHETLEQVSQDDIERDRALRRAIFLSDMTSMRNEARRKGLAEGKEKGREEGREEGKRKRDRMIVINMLNNNLTKDQIADYTGLSKEEIDEAVNRVREED